MPTLKLTYFPSKGRAEPIRLAFYIGGVPFVDERITGAQFIKTKESLPFQQLPVLTVDGKIISQSMGIFRYAGVLSNLYPANDPFQALLVDQIIFQCQDTLELLLPTVKEKDHDKMLLLRKALVEDVWPRYFKELNDVLGMYGGKAAVGDKLTIADLMVHALKTQITAGILEAIPITILDAYEHIVKVTEDVAKHPKVIEWYSTHK